MKSKIIFLCAFFFGNDYLMKINGSETTPETHAFHAAVAAAGYFCNGILIAPNYVLAPANCVNGSTSATVYLGFHAFPLYKSNRLENNTQIIPSSDIIIHEDFAIKDKIYLNDIALVKLSKSATLNKKVQPGTLLSRQESYLVEGKYGEVSGWNTKTNENKKNNTIKIKNRDTCSYLFGDGYLRSQQFCFTRHNEIHLNLIGNSIRIGDDIIGFLINKPPCAVATSECTRASVSLNFLPFLDWMSYEMHVPIDEFTSKSRESCKNQDLTKLEGLVKKKINETLYNDNKKFVNILTQDTLDERLGYINTTIKSILSEQHHFQSQFNLNEKEFKNHSSNERESFAKLEKTLSDMEKNKLKIHNRLSEIENVYHSLKEEIKSIQVRVNKIWSFIYGNQYKK